MQDPKVLVVGIDGSDASSGALAWAASEAARRGAHLRVVRAYSVPVYSGGFDAVLGSTSAYAISHARCPIAIIHSDAHPS